LFYKKKNLLSIKISFVILSVIILVFLLFSWFSNNLTPKLIHVAELSMNKYILHTASNFKTFTLEKNSSDNFLKISENQEGEISGIDYDMMKIYQLADRLTNDLENNIMDCTILNEYLMKDETYAQEDGLLLFFPIGLLSDSIFLANLGPKIPVLVKFIHSVFSSVKTRVRDYGINNVLLEVYLDITVNYEILTPITMEEKSFQYELLLDSKVIQGKVPSLYGGMLESRSAFFDIPF